QLFNAARLLRGHDPDLAAAVCRTYRLGADQTRRDDQERLRTLLGYRIAHDAGLFTRGSRSCRTGGEYATCVVEGALMIVGCSLAMTQGAKADVNRALE